MQAVGLVTTALFRAAQHEAVHAGVLRPQGFVERIGVVIRDDARVFQALHVARGVAVAGGDELHLAVEGPVENRAFFVGPRGEYGDHEVYAEGAASLRAHEVELLLQLGDRQRSRLQQPDPAGRCHGADQWGARDEADRRLKDRKLRARMTNHAIAFERGHLPGSSRGECSTPAAAPTRSTRCTPLPSERRARRIRSPSQVPGARPARYLKPCRCDSIWVRRARCWLRHRPSNARRKSAP